MGWFHLHTPASSCRERAPYRTANVDLPAMKAGCLCTMPLSSWGLSGHQQYQAGTCCPHGGGEVKLCCHLSPSTALFPPKIHTQSTRFAPSKGSPGPCHQQPWLSSCSSSTEHRQPPPQKAKHPPPSQARPWRWENQTWPGLTIPFLPGERWGRRGWRGWGGGEEKTRANPFAADFKVNVSRSLRNSLSTK